MIYNESDVRYQFFPNQDTMPKGGFGNLIALPLQKAVRRSGNSVFIDERFHAYEDQWEFPAQTRRLSQEEIGALISKLCPGSVLGVLRQDDEEPTKPWETIQSKLSQHEFPNVMQVVKANMLYVSKSNASSRALNALKRLAAFKDPLFYRAQAMRLCSARRWVVKPTLAFKIPGYLVLTILRYSAVPCSILRSAGSIFKQGIVAGRHAHFFK